MTTDAASATAGAIAACTALIDRCEALETLGGPAERSQAGLCKRDVASHREMLLHVLGARQQAAGK